MINGRVNALGEARIPLSIRGSNGREIEIEAIVDTGFTGFLTLPQTTLTELELEWRGREPAILGDGSVKLFDAYLGEVRWGVQLRRIEVNASETDPLAGMGLMQGHRLQIDVVEGGQVIVESLPLS